MIFNCLVDGKERVVFGVRAPKFGLISLPPAPDDLNAKNLVWLRLFGNHVLTSDLAASIRLLGRLRPTKILLTNNSGLTLVFTYTDWLINPLSDIDFNTLFHYGAIDDTTIAGYRYITLSNLVTKFEAKYYWDMRTRAVSVTEVDV